MRTRTPIHATRHPARQAAFVATYGPWALVTGATDGIGRATAELLAARGLHLVLVARREERLAQIAASLSHRHGRVCRTVPVDLTGGDAMARIAAASDDLDIGLVVAAAGYGSSGPVVGSDADDERQMIALNCTSVLDLVHHFAPRLRERRRGGFILWSSVLAFQGVPYSANYAAAKAWVQSFAEGLRVELAPSGVDVLVSAPGPTHTGFAARAGLTMGRALPADIVAGRTLDALGRRTTVRPGWLSLLLGGSLATLPRAVRTRVLAGIMRSMCQHPGNA